MRVLRDELGVLRDELGNVHSYAMVISMVALGGFALLGGLGTAFDQTLVGKTASQAFVQTEASMAPAVSSSVQAGSVGNAVRLARRAMRNAQVARPKIDKAFDVARDVLARSRTHVATEAAVFDTGDTLFVPTRADDAIPNADFRGAVGTHIEVDSAGTGFNRVVLVGLGDTQQPADMRDVGHQIAKLARQWNETTVQVMLRSEDAADYQRVTEGMLLADYNFDMLKSAPKVRETLRVGIGSEGKGWKSAALEGVKRGSAYAESVALTRDLTALPPNILNTSEMVALAALIADRRGLDFEVFSKPDLLKQNMNLLHGVGMASDNPPYLVRLRHQGDGSKHVAAVGKGITYDSGGLSIKGNPTGMKGDMSGSAAVLAAIDGAVATRQLDTTVDVYLPLAENAIGPVAQRVDDVVRGRSGLSVEIGNTDAEGRLVMADALAYATEDGARKPDSIVTVSTLTGANASTFGGEYAGLFTRYPELRERLLRAAQTSGEKVWPMPMDEFYDARLASDIADIGNIGSGGAGAITAAIFLSKHVGNDVPFAQLDIAGTALRKSARGRLPRGASGSSTALLIDWFTNP